jgi:hypothetical protein
VDLPIAFDGWSRMEVDLLCADSRVVVELDGGQPLSDPVAYRRDRHKDQLLRATRLRKTRRTPGIGDLAYSVPAPGALRST